MEEKLFSNLMEQYTRLIDSQYKEYNRLVGNNERLSVSPAQFVMMHNFFWQKRLEEQAKERTTVQNI